MTVLLGVFYHFLGGFASGSFYLPYRRVRKWSWESYWIVGGIFSWVVAPLVTAALTVPGFRQIIASTSASTLFWTYFMGLLWGIGGLTFGLSMRYLGLSLGMAVALGFCSTFGALVPPIFRDIRGLSGETFSGLFQTTGGRLILMGSMVCLVGIAICGVAGMRKEKEVPPDEARNAIKEFKLKRGLVVAIFSGVLSACFNFAIAAGAPMAAMAVERGVNPLFQNNVIFVVLLTGGLTTNLLWCVVLNFKNKSFRNYVDRGTPLINNYFFAALAGTIWFLQYLFYGMGASKLQNGASSWILHMAFIIVVSSMWGFALREWRGVSARTLRTVLLGITVILMSVALVGYGNSLIEH